MEDGHNHGAGKTPAPDDGGQPALVPLRLNPRPIAITVLGPPDSGLEFPVPVAYRCGPFYLHRTVLGSGWTVTAANARMSVITGVRTRYYARHIADSLCQLTQKWDQILSQADTRTVLNPRERLAILNLVHERRTAKQWTFQR